MALHAKILKSCCKKIRQAKVKIIKAQGVSIYAIVHIFELAQKNSRSVMWTLGVMHKEELSICDTIFQKFYIC